MGTVTSRLRRALGRGLAWSRRFAWGRTLSQALRLRRPWRYVATAALGRPGPRRYELRAGGVSVLLRHRSLDVTTYDEIFCSAAYEPPPQVASMLTQLGRPPRVADLGANVGFFGAFAIGRWPGASITAFEPDPDNLALLRRVAELNRDRGSCEIVAAAAATAAGTIRFVAGLQAQSHRVHPDEDVATIDVPAVDAFALLERVDLLKMDIEGGEWELLGDPRLAGSAISAIVLEHHHRHCPGADPRATATRLLTGAGYHVSAGGADVGGVGTLWAWR